MDKYGVFSVDDSAPDSLTNRKKGIYIDCFRKIDQSMKKLGSESDPAGNIDQFLQKLCSVFSAEVVMTFELNMRGNYDCTFSTDDRELSSDTENLHDIPAVDLTDWTTAFHEGSGYYIYDMDAFKKSHSRIGDILADDGIRNTVIVPLYIQGRYLGFVNASNIENSYFLPAMSLLGMASNYIALQFLFVKDKNAEKVVKKVHDAMKNKWLKVYFQPVVNTMNGRVYSMEALSRWVDPVYGFLNPGQFIDILESYKLLYKVDLFVIKEVCLMLRKAMDDGFEVCSVSVNISRQDLAITDLHEQINEILDKFRIPRDYIYIEITETALIANEDIIRRHIERFHKDGYRVWLDDFGSGFSSLNTIQNFDFDLVKIDMMFLRHQTEKTPVLMKSIVNLCKKLGMMTLSEGVETKDNYEFLKEIGCSLAQGYYFSKPDSISDLLKKESISSLGLAARKEIVFLRHLSNVNVLDSVDPLGLSDQTHVLPSAIIKLDSGSKEFLYVNAPFKRFLESEYRDSFDNIRVYSDLWEGEIYEAVKKVTSQAYSTREQAEYDFVLPTITGRLSADFIMEYLGQKAYYLQIHDIVPYNSSSAIKIRTVHDLYSLFDLVGMIYPDTDRYVQIYGRRDKVTGIDDMKAAEFITKFKDGFIHPADKEEFENFMDLNTIEERLNGTGGILNAFFHVKNFDGDYKWKRIVIKSEISAGIRKYLIGVARNTVGWTEERLKKAAELDDIPANIQYHKESESLPDETVLWNSLVLNERLGIFWKDKNRRFIGANPAFFNYYNITPHDLIGHTDEEMDWHPYPEPFKKDEEKVLRDGTKITDSVGECIVQGEVRKLLVSKAPIIEKGKITGLVVCFLDITNAGSLLSRYESGEVIDRETGFLNSNGMFRALVNAENDYMKTGHDFAFISIQILDIRSFRESYGREAYIKLLKLIGQKIISGVPAKSQIAHISGGSFKAVVRVSGPNELNSIRNNISAALKAAHELCDGTPVSVYFMEGDALYSHYKNIDETSNAALESMEKMNDNEETLENNLRMLSRSLKMPTAKHSAEAF
ncbi:MAG: EAL domain-containing protein [Lachnospiraceae bacterium]|nr:EAL domain-containing protein [Lachnospiraceae bacterium]MEE3461488.1 EAL domain-containing protein [Lachnospiraceae bacterium]